MNLDRSKITFNQLKIAVNQILQNLNQAKAHENI